VEWRSDTLFEKVPILAIDASVVVKWYSREKMHDRALKLKHDYLSRLVGLGASSPIFYEMGSALRYHPGSTEKGYAEDSTQLQNLVSIIREPGELVI